MIFTFHTNFTLNDIKFGDPMIEIELANLVLRIKFTITIFCLIRNKVMEVYKDLDTTSILYIKIFVLTTFIMSSMFIWSWARWIEEFLLEHKKNEIVHESTIEYESNIEEGNAITKHFYQ